MVRAPHLLEEPVLQRGLDASKYLEVVLFANVRDELLDLGRREVPEQRDNVVQQLLLHSPLLSRRAILVDLALSEEALLQPEDLGLGCEHVAKHLQLLDVQVDLARIVVSAVDGNVVGPCSAINNH